MTPAILITIFILLGVVIFPYLNRQQFSKLPDEQKVRVLMKEATGLIYFKNVSQGTSGTLYYVKNKRKIYTYPWELRDGKMLCTREALFDKWDYPEENPDFSDEEIAQALGELEKYNNKNTVKLYINYEPDK